MKWSLKRMPSVQVGTKITILTGYTPGLLIARVLYILSLDKLAPFLSAKEKQSIWCTNATSPTVKRCGHQR